MSTPSVTVVIPTFNRASLVGHAIRSALEQDHPVAVVVVDDGSRDSTADALAEFAADGRVTIVRHERNCGPSAAKNTGLDHLPSHSVYFGILDSDDRLLPGAVRALVAGFAAAPGGVSQVFGWCRDSASGEPTGQAPRSQGTIGYEDALCGRFSGEFWQLARVDLLAGRRFEPRALGGEGWLWWRLLRDAPAWLIPTVVRDYDRAGTDRVSRAVYDERSAFGRMWAYRALLDGLGPDVRRTCPGHYSDMLAEAAKWGMLAGDRPYARSTAFAAFRIRPTRRSAALVVAQVLPRWLTDRLLKRWRGD